MKNIKGSMRFVFLTVCPILFPLVVFFIFNLLSPYWWDDFPNACFTVSWSQPRDRLLNSFYDIIKSTYNLYRNPELAGNGRLFINFLTLVFCSIKNKLIFDVFNTIMYAIFILLIGYHICGSIKKISPLLYLFINTLVWMFAPAWGQNFLWVTGSFNYLWSLTVFLLFLIPYKQKFENSEYKLNLIQSILFFFVGIFVGWSMQNLDAGAVVFLCCYFMFKIIKKEKINLFEVLGTIGLLTGFWFLVVSSNTQFSDIKGLISGFDLATNSLIKHSGILVLASIILVAKLDFQKLKLNLFKIAYFLIALVAFYSLILGYIAERALLIPNVFFIITVLALSREIKIKLPRLCRTLLGLCFVLIFLQSFFQGGKSIVKSYLISEAREQYILQQKSQGNLEVYVKTPITIDDSHSALHGGMDIFSNPEEYQYKVHNIAKSVFYGVNSLTGITTTMEQNTLSISLKEYFQRRKIENLSYQDMFTIIYNNW
ncbi:MAG: hypothetical protein Ta2A_04540 [Treponemataceae bacterium]|nr:MAG: hypothetical protein Ta2A_04540 [Treponemataceae bacterium]